MKRSRIAAATILAAIVALGAAPSGAERGTGGRTLATHVEGVARIFNESPFLGGQVPPRLYKWANEDVSIFVQLDRSNPAEARAIRYIGIGIKGTFCAEAQPGGANGGFTHYHRVTAPVYAQGHGGQPGESNGYWLLWVAVDDFDAFDGRRVLPGVDYQFSPTPPPACGANVPVPSFQAPGADDLTRAEIRQLVRFFHDNPLLGGQQAPRHYRWVSPDVLAFVEFDHRDPAKATALRYFGIAKRGLFCTSERPHADFTHFQRRTAPTYAAGRGGRPRQAGFWHLALAVDEFDRPWGHVVPGVDRKFEATAAPDCPKA
jgi:hypothetical protein